MCYSFSPFYRRSMFFQKIKFPEYFKLDFDNVENVINFINKIYKRKSWLVVDIDCSYLKEVESKDFILFKALLEKINVKNCDKRKFQKNKQRISLVNVKPNKISYVKKIVRRPRSSNENTWHLTSKNLAPSFIKKYSNSIRVDTKIIESIVNELKYIGIKEYYSEFHNILVEMVLNSVEHGIKEKHINWWISEQLDKKYKTITYTCIDMGCGIIQSYKNAKTLSYKDRLLKNKKDFLIDALNGKHGSSTRTEGRGTGLPTIHNAVIEQWISDFVLITNNVYLAYDNNKKEYKSKIIPNFVGTYYSWTITVDCFKKWKDSL